MRFPTVTSPHTERPNSVTRTMLWVIIALVPGSRTSFYVGYATGGVFFTNNLILNRNHVQQPSASTALSCTRIGTLIIANIRENYPPV